jgi:hypothetical protein
MLPVRTVTVIGGGIGRKFEHNLRTNKAVSLLLVLCRDWASQSGFMNVVLKPEVRGTFLS